ncbi:MAG TPA: sugar transferase, partial [Gaiellaceae bacterium]|nr:sugar transferase [Gaiellaceae bacterium]
MKPAYAADQVARAPGNARSLGLHWTEFVIALVAADAAIVAGAMIAVVLLWDRLRPGFTPTEYFGIWSLGTWLVWLIALRLSGSYDLLASAAVRGHAASIVRALGIVAMATLVTYFFAPRSFPRSTSLITPIPIFLGLLAWREIAAARLLRWGALHRRVLLLGVGETTTRLAAALGPIGRHVPYDCVAFLTDRDAVPASIVGIPVRHGVAQLWDHVRELGVREISIAREEPLSPELRETLLDSFHEGVAVTDAAQLYEDLTGRVPIAQIASTWYAELPSVPRRPYYALKRVIDVIASAVLLVVLSPVLLLLALAVLVDDGPPVLYSQSRLG